MRNIHKLTKQEIYLYYSHQQFLIARIDILSCFGYWLILLNEMPLKTLDFSPVIKAFSQYLDTNIKENDYYRLRDLEKILNEKAFLTIPELTEWSQMKPGGIDLSVLSESMIYMILRLEITGQFD